MKRWMAPWLCMPLLALAQGPGVTIHYFERPPFYQLGSQGLPQGLVMTPLRQAIAKAGLPVRWARTPSQRQLLLIEQGRGLHCGVGWFRTPAREAMGQFSASLYLDSPLVLIARQDAGLRPGMAVAEVLAGPQRALVKGGFSYGQQLDSLFKRRQTPTQQAYGDMPQLLRMLVANRADWTLVSAEEATSMLDGLGSQHGLQILPFADAPGGRYRHLYCNKAVPTNWLQRLDAALAGR